MKNLTLFAALFSLFSSSSAQITCPIPYDSNFDGLISVSDLLDLQSVFGLVDVDQDGIDDAVDLCLDLAACNFLSNPTEVCKYLDAIGICGGSCISDSDLDGICDDVDTCDGVLDVCGVCNGIGPLPSTIESITILYDSVYAAQINDWVVFESGADTVYLECYPAVFTTCGDDLGYEGHNYSTVQIGSQCWFSENCRYLPSVSPTTTFSVTSPVFNVYNYMGSDVAEAMSTVNYNTYGVLYNYEAVMSPGVCPTGWHVSTNLDWEALAYFLGGVYVAGEKLKSTTGWYSNFYATNSTGFTALPGGWNFVGSYEIGLFGAWWSISDQLPEDQYRHFRRLFYISPVVQYGNEHKLTSKTARSARCILN
ncbi:MAG: hypothetical protein COA49_05105 [Bacteroidetes bacterium]|nr:MAG: hypothetical protein COA49_05105 [Bacteroidota bacterium]